MNLKTLINRFVTTVPPWGLIGAALILLPMLAFVTYEDINRQKAASRRQLLAKGAALIRSFEAGTRAGMMMRQWGNPHLQRLLVETARQPDISYLMVTDTNGEILAHSNPDKIGQRYGEGLALRLVAEAAVEIYRLIDQNVQSTRIFEVYRKFSPDRGPRGMMGRHHGMMRQFWKNGRPDHSNDRDRGNDFKNLIIFVGLDMTEVQKTLTADTRHSLFMAAILLLVGFAGVTLLFMTHTYRVTRASLKRIESFSDNLVDNLPVGLISLDADNRMVTVNPEVIKILRLERLHLIGQPMDTILPARLQEAIRDLGTADRAVETELVCHLGTAGSLPIGLNASTWHDREGVFMGTILLIRDLSEIEALRKEIARSQRLASLGSLAAGVAHEIRNPLSSIKGFATYFKEKYNAGSRDHDTAAIMISEVDRLNRVVGQLLELSRPIELLKKPVPLTRLIDDSLTLIRPRAEEAGIDLAVDVPDRHLAVNLDADRVNQVLLNLYLNALEAMHPEGGRITISAGSAGRFSGATIAVSDTGPGIKRTDLPHIFDPYFTGKSTGTGLGLAIVHNIMEAHNGTVTVNSRPGEATVFTLFFPAEKIGDTDD